MHSVPLVSDSSPKTVLKYLRDAGSPQQIERVRKRGVPKSSIYGVPKPVVLKAAKILGKNQELAETLWDSDIHEARLLAILVANPGVISNRTLKTWSDALWSWDITDHLARYLLPHIRNPEPLLVHCVNSDLIFTKRLAFAGIACLVQKRRSVSTTQFDDYSELIRQGAVDGRHHVRKAIVWALVEMGKVNDSCQDAAIVFAAELAEDDDNVAWVGRNAMKELELLVDVPDRGRLLSRKSKTARKNRSGM